MEKGQGRQGREGEGGRGRVREGDLRGIPTNIGIQLTHRLWLDELGT